MRAVTAGMGAVAVAAAAALAGCRTPTPSNEMTLSAEPPGNVRAVDFTKEPGILVGDGGLIQDLAIERALVRTLPSGLPQAQSYFERFTVELSAWAKEGDFEEPDVQGRIDDMLEF